MFLVICPAISPVPVEKGNPPKPTLSLIGDPLTDQFIYPKIYTTLPIFVYFPAAEFVASDKPLVF